MMGVRKLLDYVFTKKELKILDDILPEFKRHEQLDDEEAMEEEVERVSKLTLTNSTVGQQFKH